MLHNVHVIPLMSLQLHHHTLLIKLTLLQLHHHTSLIKLTSITALHLNYSTFSKLTTSPNATIFYTVIITLHHPCILPMSPMTRHLQIQSGFQVSYPAPTFVSPFHIFVLITISNNTWDTSKLLLFSGNIETNPGLRPVDMNPVLWTYSLQKLIRGFNKKQDLHVQLPTVMHDVIKPAMVLLTTKLATQNLVVVLSRENVLNMALVLPRLSFCLLQLTSYLSVLLLQVNCALYVKILFVLVMLT